MAKDNHQDRSIADSGTADPLAEVDPGPENASWPPPDADYYFADQMPDGRHVLYRLSRRGKRKGLSLFRDDNAAADRRLTVKQSVQIVRTRVEDADPELFRVEPKFFTHKVLEVLEVLVFAPQAILSKDEVIAKLWNVSSDHLHFDSHLANLDQYIWRVRKLLHDDEGDHCRRLIKGLGEKRLKFDAEVDLRAAAESSGTTSEKYTPLDPFASVPPSDNFIKRQEISERLIAKLLSTSGPVAITAIEGMGGVGKTMVAIGLCHESVVRDRFPDGIVWLKVGREPIDKLDARFKKIAIRLNQEFREYSEESYRTLFADKAILIVLDDVWHREDLVPFRLPPGRSRLVYTTRIKALSSPLRAVEEEVGLLNDETANCFLSYWAAHHGELPEPHASGIIEECRGLALALSMIGASLKGKGDKRWGDILSHLRAARLKNIHGSPDDYRYETLHAAIAVSLDALEVEVKSRDLRADIPTCYRRLATLLEDMPASVPILRALWGGKDETEIRDIADLFVERCLARWEAGCILLHNLQLAFLRGEFEDRKALAAIHVALGRSAHLLTDSPEQFASQMTGRLLPYVGESGIQDVLSLLERNEPRPRLRPLWPALATGRGPSRRVLAGHSRNVESMAISANGRWAVSASGDGVSIVWDLEEKLAPRFLRNDGLVWALAISVDGRRVVSSYIEAIVVADADGSGHSLVHYGQEGPATLLAVTLDGNRIISGSRDGRLRLWDVSNSLHARVFEGGGSWRAVSTNGRWAISDGLILWDLDGQHEPLPLKGSQNVLSAIAVSSDGRRIFAYAGAYETLVEWSLDDNRQQTIKTFCHNNKEIALHAAISADRRRVVRGTILGLEVYDVGMRTRLLNSSTIYQVAISPDGNKAISTSGGKSIVIWDLAADDEPPLSQRCRLKLHDLATSADGTRAVSCSSDKTLMLWDLTGKQTPRPLEGHQDLVMAAAISGDGQSAISGSADGALMLWNLNGRPQPRLVGFNGEANHVRCVSCLAMSADGRWAASAADDAIIIWDLTGQHEPTFVKGCGLWIEKIAMSADGSRILYDTGGGELIVGNLLNRGWNLHRLTTVEYFTDSIAISADGTWGVSSSWDDAIVVWDLDNRLILRSFPTSGVHLNNMALSLDQRLLASTSDDSLTVRDIVTGEELATFSADNNLTACAWASFRIITGDGTGAVHLLAFEQ